MDPDLLAVLVVAIPLIVWWRTRSIRAAFVILAVVLVGVGVVAGLR